MNRRSRYDSTPSASTLALQISSNQPRRCHSGFFPALSVIIARLRSVIALVGRDLAAEHVVAPRRVHQDEGDDEQRADQREALALRWRGGLPDGQRAGHDMRPQADAQAAVAE